MSTFFTPFSFFPPLAKYGDERHYRHQRWSVIVSFRYIFALLYFKPPLVAPPVGLIFPDSILWVWSLCLNLIFLFTQLPAHCAAIADDSGMLNICKKRMKHSSLVKFNWNQIHTTNSKRELNDKCWLMGAAILFKY